KLVTQATTPGAIARRAAAGNDATCATFAEPVRANCTAEADGMAFLCAEVTLAANHKPRKCDPSLCYNALVNLGRKCPKALGKKSHTLDADLVADVTGIEFQNKKADQHVERNLKCRRHKKCKPS